MTRWLSVAQVASRLGCHPHTVHRLIRSGALPAVRVGPGHGTFRITEAEFSAYLQRRAS